MASGMRQVVVTGVGAVTPLGSDAASTWSGLLAGRCGVVALAEEWADPLPVRIAARVAADQAEPDRAARFLLSAVAEAWRDAGFGGPAGGPGAPRPERLAVCVGTGVGSAAALAGSGGGGPAWPGLMLHGPAARAGWVVGAQAGAHTIGGGCAAGADAIAYALSMIRAGRADVVAAGGTEAAVHPLAIAAFARMSALSRRNQEPARACRPYDKNRDGFVIGEGAGVLILESAEHALARGARFYCELAGAGAGADGYHMTRPEPGGRGMRQALRAALADSGLAAADVAHVNAHATASGIGDVAESRALAAALGVGGYCVSATKSMTGHLIGAAGAVEAIATVLALRDRLAPPTINVDDLDDGIDADVVREEPRPLPAGPAAALSNSAAFGGHNVVLAFRSPGPGRGPAGAAVSAWRGT